jgi:purine-nucleoside phosphorylase
MQLKYGFSIDSIQNSCNKFAVQIVKNKIQHMKTKQLFITALFSFASALAAVVVYNHFLQDTPTGGHNRQSELKQVLLICLRLKTPVSPSTSVMQLQRLHHLLCT